VDARTARDRLEVGIARLQMQRGQWERREAYLNGQQDLPYAPPGVSAEYLDLREQAVANWLPIPMLAPVQRCRPDGFRTGKDADADAKVWEQIWQPNQLDERIPIVFTQSMVHGRGIVSVTKSDRPRRPAKISVESSKRVWLEPDPEDPFETEFAVKLIALRPPTLQSGLLLPSGVSSGFATERAYVYDRDSWAVFERGGVLGAWELKNEGQHGFGEVPFVSFDIGLDGDGVPHSAVEKLMPQQDAINTIRFNTLLAMQYSAYRQRGVSGYDPVLRDSSGQPIYQKDKDGNLVLDEFGQPKPIVNAPGRAAVDRMLVFPGKDTKVWDLQESNLGNYIEVLDSFLSQFFAIGQVPPQYLLTRMANLSGDALTGAESTLQALVSDLQRGWGESIEKAVRLGGTAMGWELGTFATETIWADAEARSFAQTVDAIVKLVAAGFPERAAWQMLPGATTQKVREWSRMADEERSARANAVLDDVDEVDPPARRVIEGPKLAEV
jgi:hypothetical protein